MSSRVPSSASSVWMRLLTAGWEMRISLAASLKLPERAVRAKACNWRMSMADITSAYLISVSSYL